MECGVVIVFGNRFLQRFRFKPKWANLKLIIYQFYFRDFFIFGLCACMEQGQYKVHLKYIKYIQIFQASAILPRQILQYKYVIKASNLAKQSNLEILKLSFYSVWHILYNFCKVAQFGPFFIFLWIYNCLTITHALLITCIYAETFDMVH